ncbi:hypothetical protein HYDPIDRAFT_23118 [Hydnomerulius pinastri MD-312]|nr:hypothetical protein HYDPIDRAFT_23118 [Hydnomerulius pinastri MD-312]
MTNGEPQGANQPQPAFQAPREEKEIKLNIHQPGPSKPVEALASTSNASNGRPAEPTNNASLAEKLRQALHHIKLLETQNTKLFEDNCQLVAAVNMLNERQAFAGASSHTQMLHLAEMQEKLRASESGRSSLSRKYQELLTSVSAGSIHQHVTAELHNIRNAHTQLDKEYHLLREKYARLKNAWSMSPSAQQTHPVPPQTSGAAPQVLRSQNPMAFPQRRSASGAQIRTTLPQSRSNPVSPTTPISPDGLPGSLQQQQSHNRRRSSDSITQQSQFRPGPSPVSMTWLPVIPTPPPSAPLVRGPISPTTGFPVHVPMQGVHGMYPPHVLAHHAPPAAGGTRTVSAPAGVPRARQHSVPQFATPIPSAHRTKPDQRTVEVVDLTSDHQGVAGSPKMGSGTPPTSASPRSNDSLKRPRSELQASTSHEGERKKPRLEGEAQATPAGPSTAGAGTPNHSPGRAKSSTLTAPSSAVLSPTASVETKAAASDDESLRTYDECVYMIFEKDADVENGVFCGLCLDRYEAKMISEPPDILIQPDFDLLVKHCMTIHPTVWEDLRHPKDLAEKQ